MREITRIVIHCTATDQTATVHGILKYWREVKGWKNPGYHFLVDADGNITQLQDLNKPSNGARGYNHDSIHAAYIGGIDSVEAPKDTRTNEQCIAMEGLVKALKGVYDKATICGHRDLPGVKKDCPSFEVKQWLKEIKI